MTRFTGLGSLPGTDFRKACQLTFELVPDFPYLPELPARGPWAAMIGRGMGVLSEIEAQYDAGEWRLAPHPGVDLKRARTTLRDDLDQLEEIAQGYQGRFKLQVTGPWTICAAVMAAYTVRVLADLGARRDLAQGLAAGVSDLLAEVQRRIPGAQLTIQIDEPSLPAVLAGRIPTPGGLFNQSAVDLPEAVTALAEIVAVSHNAGAQAVIHCCSAGLPIAALSKQGGFDAVSLDQNLLAAADFEHLAETIESGSEFWLGVIPTTDPAVLPSIDDLRGRALQTVERIGVSKIDELLVLTPTCGLAGFSQVSVREVFTKLAHTASQVSQELDSC